MIKWFEGLFYDKKYKCDESHGYFQVLSAMETLRFSQLNEEVGVSKSELIRVFFVYYMVESFIDWGLETLKYLEYNKKLPKISKKVLWGIIHEYRNRAIREWESNWNNNRSMRLLVSKVDEVRHDIVDNAYDKVMKIYNRRKLSPDDKLDLILDSLKETFFSTFIGFNEVARQLNGELTTELKKWEKLK